MAERLTNNMVGTFCFVLKVDGAVLEEIPVDDAVEYLHGAENIIPGLEKALAGKQAGDKFTITVEPPDAYGDYDEMLVQDIHMDDIDGGEELEEGMMIELYNDEDEDIMDAVITDVYDDLITIDMNHELAGKTLVYDVEVLSVRAATDVEIEDGLPQSILDEVNELIMDGFDMLEDADE